MPAPEPIDPECWELASGGAMSVKQALKACGESRTRLIQFMDAGVIEWYYSGRHRRVVKKSLRAFIARMLMQHKATQTKPT